MSGLVVGGSDQNPVIIEIGIPSPARYGPDLTAIGALTGAGYAKRVSDGVWELNAGTGAGSGGARYERSFVDGDLTGGGLLIVSHALGVIPSSIQVLNASGEEYFPDSISGISTTALSVGLGAFRTLSGIWKVIITG
jgi:hypothetical protein